MTDNSPKTDSGPKPGQESAEAASAAAADAALAARNNAPSDTLLEFPCDFPIKVFGRGSEDFESLVVELVSRHVELDGDGEASAFEVSVRSSKGGRYHAVSVTIRAHSKAQLDAIYTDLSGHERVIMAL